MNKPSIKTQAVGIDLSGLNLDDGAHARISEQVSRAVLAELATSRDEAFLIIPQSFIPNPAGAATERAAGPLAAAILPPKWWAGFIMAKLSKQQLQELTPQVTIEIPAAR